MKRGNLNEQVLFLISFWLPVAVQMGLIFYFSSQPSGSPALERFPLPAGPGHLGGYGLLALLLYRAFNKGFLGWNLRAAGYTFLAAFIYGITDEFHQTFVPGRQASVSDVFINAVGIALALVVIRFMINGWFYRRCYNFSRKISDL